ncbi:MAG: hypothetical protein WC570_00730 [Patescibacteria group bacterium]
MDKDNIKISDKVIDKIKQENVKPIPRWHFWLQHGFLWVLLVILLLLGAISLGITFFELTDVEWGLRPMLGIGLGHWLFSFFPYFWSAILIVVAVLAYYNFLNTPKGYRYPKYQVILFGLILIILTAGAFHYAGLAKKARNFLHDRAPIFQNFMPNKDQLYYLPDQGLLAGKIIDINDESLTLKTIDPHDWKVDIGEAKIPPGKKLENGQKIKILGKKTGEFEFKAEEFRPWQAGDMLRLNNMPKGFMGGPKN